MSKGPADETGFIGRGRVQNLHLTSSFSKKEEKSTKPKSGGVGINLVNEIGELWDEREYDEEFKVNQFLKKLKN